MNKNKGYWKVAGTEYYNKIQAIIRAQELGLDIGDIKFCYNDQWWDAVDWSTEPKETLDELYLRRAQQLREKYKTIILRFSGGADSTNVLRTFIDNNIKIDVISINLWKEGDPDNTIVPNNIEKELLAFPLLRELQQKGAQFDIVITDQSKLFSIVESDPKWFLNIDAPRLTAIDVTAYRSCTGPDYEQWNNESTCVIVGVDKPQVWCMHDKIWHFKVCDFLHTMHSQSNSMVPEPFYWTADMPEIPIKQSHVVKKFYQKNMHLMYEDNEVGDGTTKTVVGKNKLISLIYPKYFGHVDPTGPLPYYDMSESVPEFKKRHQLGTFAPRGMGSDTTLHLSPHYSAWVHGIEEVDQLIERRFKNKDTVWQGGLIQLYTKPRWLGK
jgi:hypothetical protein